MSASVKEIESELKELIETGDKLLLNLLDQAQKKKTDHAFQAGYDSWYTEAQRVVSQIIPDRLHDFVSQYKYPGTRKTIDYASYGISDFLHGTSVSRGGERVFEPSNRAFSQFQTQLLILSSSEKSLHSSLMNIREMLQADLFDNELEKAMALLKNKFLREAGVVAGVVLEEHLQTIALSHDIKLNKASPTIGDLNDPLKKANVYDTPTWRLIQRLGDIRNLCDHKKERDPTLVEVSELIDGVTKVTKTVF